ncbi:hypothetical protein R1flu_004469 [Riccia fluitans]|uniref:DUF676 domain-containing protein n=1 Tax=Riccia fluitans TaxID=41844 RepID=A0ABD1YQD5_9MARC
MSRVIEKLHGVFRRRSDDDLTRHRSSGKSHPRLAADCPTDPGDVESAPEKIMHPTHTDFSMDKIFFPLVDNSPITENTTVFLYFHGLAADGKYGYDSHTFVKWLKGHAPWLSSLEKDFPESKVYAASYEKYGEEYAGKADLYTLGHHMFYGFRKIDSSLNGQGPLILIGHSVGGLVIKQLILEAELRENSFTESDGEDRSLSFLRRLAGIFYLSTPHSDSVDLMRFLARSKSPIGTAFATLGKVTQRLNHQFLDRRRALGIPSAAVFEGQLSKVDGFNNLVVTERSARMDVDIAVRIAGQDHFNISSFKASDKIYTFLKDQISGWVKDYKSKRDKRDELVKKTPGEFHEVPSVIPESPEEGEDNTTREEANKEETHGKSPEGEQYGRTRKEANKEETHGRSPAGQEYGSTTEAPNDKETHEDLPEGEEHRTETEAPHEGTHQESSDSREREIEEASDE